MVRQQTVNLILLLFVFFCKEMSKGLTTGDVWFRFKEGYLNAVRKTVRIQDLMSWEESFRDSIFVLVSVPLFIANVHSMSRVIYLYNTFIHSNLSGPYACKEQLHCSHAT